jgi:GH15 family glucan-1,4-alpha-glucosidase
MPTTPASTRSAPALYLSNWQDLVAIWAGRRLAQTDTEARGPGLLELHYLGGRASTWSVNQIVGHSSVFRDETSHVSYTAVDAFASEAWFGSGQDDAGTLTTEYGSYDGAAVQPQCRITRRYAAVPHQPFVVVRCTLTNTSAGTLTFNVLDHVGLNNVAAGDPTSLVHAWHDPGRNALVADMTASGQFVVVLGAFADMTGFQVGDEQVVDPAAPTAPGLRSFDRDGTLAGNADLRAAEVDLAFGTRVTIQPGATANVDLFLAIRGDEASALAAADVARSKSADAWFAATAHAYRAWLTNGGKGKRLDFPDDGMNLLFERSLVVLKNTQHPVLGTIVASTNPYRYGYKNWVRDASIAAIALDATGHYEEAERYWRWMASVQGNDGSWKTTYSFWDGHYLSFVEPEYDSVGAFLYGVYRHYRTTGDSRFLNDLWGAVQRAADWVLTHLASNGFGAADFSIWEEPERGLQHHSFTQAWYVAGLVGAQWLAEVRGDSALSDWYAGGTASILTALQRPSGWQPPGMWRDSGNYDRGVHDDNTPAALEDSSSDILFVLGVIDHRSDRARSHVGVMTSNLTRNGYGIARYQGDEYYYTSIWDPAGDEVGGPEPSWPQLSMWVAVYEALGNRDASLRRMQWFTSTSGAGYMPQGEAVSNVTQLSVESSMSEPLTASSFVLAALCYRGWYETRVVPPIVNAGTFATLQVGWGAAGASQWADVPYFVGPLAVPPKASATTVTRVYVTNDFQNLYLRIDNAAGSLPAFGQDPRFAVRVYSQDFAGASSTVVSWGLDRQPLNRPMHFAVERRSDDDVFHHWVSAIQWEPTEPVTGVLPPQWDPATGRVELAVPISAVSSGPPAFGTAWATLAVTLARADTSPSGAVDGNRVLVHYRLSTPDQPWSYGQIER